MLEKAFFVSMYSTVNQYGDHGMEKQYSVFSTKFVVCINSYEEVFLLMYVATYVRNIHVYMYMLVDMFFLFYVKLHLASYVILFPGAICMLVAIFIIKNRNPQSNVVSTGTKERQTVYAYLIVTAAGKNNFW